MIHKIIIITYALIGTASSIAYFYQQKIDRAQLPRKKGLVMGSFFATHLLLCIVGIVLFMYTVPTPVLVLSLLLAWLSRIGNGVFIFERVHVLHHIVTACLFIAIFISYHFNL